MSAFSDVLKLVNQWQASALPDERGYRNALIMYLRERLPDLKKIESEYRHLGTTADIYVKQSSFWGDYEVFIEVKRNFLHKSQLDRLVGQIESLQPKKNAIIVVLCGTTSQALVDRLKEKYGAEGFTVILEERDFQVVVKADALSGD